MAANVFGGQYKVVAKGRGGGSSVFDKQTQQLNDYITGKSFMLPMYYSESGKFGRDAIAQRQAFLANGAIGVSNLKAGLPVGGGGSGGGGGGGGTTGIGGTGNGLPTTFEEALSQANAKNEERYSQGLDLYKEMQSNIDKFGQARLEQLQRTERQANASDTSNLVSRGLYNTTGVESLQRARAEDTGFQQTALEEAIAKSRNEVLGQQVGFVERRTDAGPDPALFAQLQTAASAAPSASAATYSGGRSTPYQSAAETNAAQSLAATQAQLAAANQENLSKAAAPKPAKAAAPAKTSAPTVKATISVNKTQDILAAFGRKGFPLGSLTTKQLTNALTKAGFDPSTFSAATVQNLTVGQWQAIKNAI